MSYMVCGPVVALARLNRLLQRASVRQIEGTSHSFRLQADQMPQQVRTLAMIILSAAPKRRGRSPMTGGIDQA